MQQILTCKSCRKALTKPVWIYDLSLGERKNNKGWIQTPAPSGSNLAALSGRDTFGDYSCPKDTALKYEKPMRHKFLPEFWYGIRPDSLTKFVTPNAHWKIQCCGVFPKDKPNISCVCGNPIGLEFGDCGALKQVWPVMGNTKWQSAS